MSDKIKIIAQANDPIIKNLQDSNSKLNELNSQVNSLLHQYQQNNTESVSFFNFHNPFFLLTLLGLFMLAFGLIFLRQELKRGDKIAKVKKIEHQTDKKEKELKVARSITKTETTEKKTLEIPKKDKKSIKIKVEKVK